MNQLQQRALIVPAAWVLFLLTMTVIAFADERAYADPRCAGPGRYDAMADGADCSNPPADFGCRTPDCAGCGIIAWEKYPRCHYAGERLTCDENNVCTEQVGDTTSEINGKVCSVDANGNSMGCQTMAGTATRKDQRCAPGQEEACAARDHGTAGGYGGHGTGPGMARRQHEPAHLDYDHPKDWWWDHRH